MMAPLAEDTRDDAGWGTAHTLRLGLDAAWHPCCVCYAEGADGTTRRYTAVRSRGLRRLAGDPAGGVKPRRLRLAGASPWGLRAPTPCGLGSAGGVAPSTTARPAQRRVVTTGRRDGRILRGAGRVGLLSRVEDRRVVRVVVGPQGID